MCVISNIILIKKIALLLILIRYTIVKFKSILILKQTINRTVTTTRVGRID